MSPLTAADVTELSEGLGLDTSEGGVYLVQLLGQQTIFTELGWCGQIWQGHRASTWKMRVGTNCGMIWEEKNQSMTILHSPSQRWGQYGA